MPVTLYNDLEFKCEDAVAIALADAAAALNLPIHKSLIADALETEHIAIIAEDGTPDDPNIATGNYNISVRVKIVTKVDQANGVDVRELHRLRTGTIRDAYMREGSRGRAFRGD
jgi:hypothetical protein